MIHGPIASRQRLFLEKTHTRSAPERASPSGPHSSRTARAQTVRPCSFWRSDALSDQKVRPTIFAPESSYFPAQKARFRTTAQGSCPHALKQQNPAVGLQAGMREVSRVGGGGGQALSAWTC